MSRRPISTRAMGLTALALLTATPLLAAHAPKHMAKPAPAMVPADVIKARIASFKEIGGGLKGIFDQLRAPEPQIALIKQSVKPITAGATGIYKWFPAGSGPESGLKTAAKPEIWTQAAKFKMAQDAFAAQAKALTAAVDGGKLDLIKAEAIKMGGTCKGCHENFRVSEHK